MAEEHKVPKGVFESATMKYGITLEQFFILSIVAIVITFLIFFAGQYTMYILVIGIVVMGVLYALMKTSNYFHKNAFQERLMYIITKNSVPRRYSGRSKH